MRHHTVKYLLCLISLTMLVVVAAGCRGDDEDIIIRPAAIEDVRVVLAQSYPPQVFASFKIGLPDSCTTFHDLTTQRQGNTINITVTTQRPRDAVCAQVYQFLDKTVNLGGDFTSGQTYTIKVNDKTATLVMP